MTPETDEKLAEEERRAEDVYDRIIRPKLKPEDAGKYLAIAFEVEDFEVDRNDYNAINRLLARRPGARIWLMRTDRQPACRIRRQPVTLP